MENIRLFTFLCEALYTTSEQYTMLQDLTIKMEGKGIWVQVYDRNIKQYVFVCVLGVAGKIASKGAVISRPYDTPLRNLTPLCDYL